MRSASFVVFCSLALAAVAVRCGSHLSPPDAGVDVGRDVGRDAGTDADAGAIWKPTPGQAWQWQLTGLPLDQRLDVPIYDVDLDKTSADTIAALHATGRKVVCYVDVGAWEDYRDDAADYPASILGDVVDGWPDENWVDIRALDAPTGPTGKTLRQILLARIDTCRAKGFDALEPDCIDGYAHSTGFPLTAEDQLAFNRFIAQAAHERGMSVALKNDKEQTADLVADFDFGIDEECQLWGECDGAGTPGSAGWRPFIDAGKAVLNAEYTDQAATCGQPAGLSSILKNRSLDAYRVQCPY